MGSEPLEAFPGCNFFLAAFDACSRYVAASLAHCFTAQPYQQVGNWYFHRTHFTTGTTQARRSRQIPGFLQPHHVRHQDAADRAGISRRSEEHTSELQSRFDLVCRLLLEKKKYNTSCCVA